MSVSQILSLLSLAIVVACHRPAALAHELRYSELGKRLDHVEPANGANSDVQLISYSHGEAQSSQMPVPDYFAAPAIGSTFITDQPWHCNEEACNSEIEESHRVLYAEVHLMFIRAHVTESVTGKLSEQYEVTPRIVLGYEKAARTGGRLRFWHYDHATPLLNGTDDAIRFEFQVYDIEGTTRFGTDRAELVVAGGFRWTDARISIDDDAVVNDMPGITFGADVRAVICRRSWCELASVGGARWSLMGGDWEGSSNGFLEPDRDDNLTVTEIYGGFEYLHHKSRFDLFARAVLEVQSWQSDVASQSAGGDSINFMGPGVHLGIIR
jgi:hypothetical protein